MPDRNQGRRNSSSCDYLIGTAQRGGGGGLGHVCGLSMGGCNT